MQAASKNHSDPATLAVVRFGAVWKVWIGQRWVGLFKQRKDAVLYAVQAAYDVEREGRPVNVLVQQPFGELSDLQLPQHPAAAGKVRLPASAADPNRRELRLVSDRTLVRPRQPIWCNLDRGGGYGS